MTRKRALAGLGLVLLAAGCAHARVGGGQSYGGGSHSGGSGGGGGDVFFLIEMLFRLIFWAPSIGIPLALIVLIGLAYLASHGGAMQFSSSETETVAPELQGATRNDIMSLRELDANFSQALFMDFVGLLYTRLHSARGTATSAAAATEDGSLAALAPYFRPSVLKNMADDAARRHIVKVSDVLVGSARIQSIEGTDAASSFVSVSVVFESNYTEATAQGTLPPLYVIERWTFERKHGVLSKGPKEITALTCPSCGSPSEVRPDGTCPYCGKVVNGGEFQWLVTSITLVSSQPRPPVDLVGGGLFSRGYERGTDLPTVYAPDFEAARRAFTARNPEFAWPPFEKKVATTFMALQNAWSSRQWTKARPYETDALFNTHRYWMDMYERQNLTNRLEDIQIQRIEPAKFDQDAFYDIITVRIFAAMRDFTVDGNNKVVSGDPNTPRTFSEYWTFVRRSGAKGPAHSDATCPHCGAPLDVNMTGECAYCNSKITLGDFDWVLSAIEQDEAYCG